MFSETRNRYKNFGQLPKSEGDRTMIETQTSWNDWADDTFGPLTDVARAAARANSEMAELISEITMPSPNLEKIAEECADVTMSLFRIAHWSGEDLMPIFELEGFIVPNKIYGPAIASNGVMAFILERLSEGNIASRVLVGRLVSMIALRMAEICSTTGITLGDAIDRKMAINRNRSWVPDGSGCGHHVPLMTIAEAREQLAVTIDEATEQLGYKPEVLGELYDCGHIHRTFEEAQQCAAWLADPREGSNARSGM
jgi:hypothetical protein